MHLEFTSPLYSRFFAEYLQQRIPFKAGQVIVSTSDSLAVPGQMQYLKQFETTVLHELETGVRA